MIHTNLQMSISFAIKSYTLLIVWKEKSKLFSLNYLDKN